MGIQRLTRIDTGDPRHLRLTDGRLFDYPWIYATQTGWWDLTDAETSRLREYFLRGGFLVVDDFWGPEKWGMFRQTMNRVPPNVSIHDFCGSDSGLYGFYCVGWRELQFSSGVPHL